MSFSREWDDIYLSNAHLSVWPWSDVVSYVHRYASPAAGFRRVLELGCGAGANIPFFQKLGVHYEAIDGSPAIVARLQETFPALAGHIVVGDFTRTLPDGEFDLILDRSSLTSNATDPIRKGLALAHQRLRRGGKLIGIDWFSTAHRDARNGSAVDAHTRKEMPAGSDLAGIGAVHFFDEEHLVDLLTEACFRIERLEHKQHDTLVPEGSGRLAWWNFVAVKP